MSYVDGYVLAIPISNKEKYIEMAKLMAGIFKEHGALEVVEAGATTYRKVSLPPPNGGQMPTR